MYFRLGVRGIKELHVIKGLEKEVSLLSTRVIN